MRKICLLILVFSIQVCYSISPRVVYRVDTRPPGVIFNIGFENLGSNIDLVRHVSGYGNSAFVATSEDLNATMRIARASYTLA
jgi:pertussis toxin subunit 1